VRRIVRGLRTFARGDHIELAEVELSQAVDIAVHLSMNELRTVTRIVKAWDPCPTIIADESQLAQIFVNLLVNAAHALAGRAMEANEIRVATRTTADGRAVVEIEDNGPGMTKEVAARAFEPFFTTKPAGQGTGLGLSIVHNLVAGMGATVDLRTAPGEGAAFTITFPHRTADELPRPPPPRGESPPTRPARVLVVDDEPSIATTVRRLLAGDDVTATTSPVEALELVTRGEDYDVVFCDLVMPELSGPMLYERVAALRPALASRFVFVTGAVTNVGAHDFLESVPNEHVDKPFQARTLRGIVRRMVAAPPTPGDERR
jgi:CheY-like chemotaxis protein/anti-sigma regulatory factor (Ser/Thr protein kinase)